jgi:hypothetical protein
MPAWQTLNVSTANPRFYRFPSLRDLLQTRHAPRRPSPSTCKDGLKPSLTDFRYFGTNENAAMIAAARTGNFGLILYLSRIRRVATAIVAVFKPITAPFANVKQPASSKPIDTGASPC